MRLAPKADLGVGCTQEGRRAKTRPLVSGLMTVSVGTPGRQGHMKWDISRLLWADLSIFFFDSFMW